MEMKKKNREFQLRREEGWDRQPSSLDPLCGGKPCNEERNPCTEESTILKNGSAHVTVVEDIECSEF